MPTRKTGDPVEVYVERDDGRKGEYRNGSVIKLVRGYGYEVMTVDDNGDQKQGTFTFAHVKAIGSRNRSRSRGRKSTVNVQTVKQVKREESPSPEREEKPTVRKSRARAASKKQTPSADMNPVDYAWANVAGEAEGRARTRRSRSRSRGRKRDDIPVEVELLQDSFRRKSTRIAKKKEAQVPVKADPVPVEQFSADEDDQEQSTAPTTKSCPWFEKYADPFCKFVGTLLTVYVAPALFAWTFYCFYAFNTFNIQEKSTQLAGAFLVAVGSLLHLKPKVENQQFFLAAIIALLSAAAFVLPANFVNENKSAIGETALLFISAYSLVGNAANSDFKLSFSGLHKYLKSFMFDNSKICARGFARAGEIITLFVIMPSLAAWNTDNVALFAAALLNVIQTSYKLMTEADYSTKIQGNGFMWAFYHVIYLPFLATIPILSNLSNTVVVIDPATAVVAAAFALLSGKLATEGNFIQSNISSLLATLTLAYTTISCPFFLLVPFLNVIFSWH